MIEILAADKYLLSQFKAAAKKSSLRLVFASAGDKCYIKPMTAFDAEKRLLLLLREPRTMNELRAGKLELDLQSSLARLQRTGCAHVVKEKWVLTEKGMDLL